VAKKFDLKEYKEQLKIEDVPLKKEKYVLLDESLQECLDLPGLPLGHITQIYGKSDTGKTSLLYHAAAQCQKQGILPVLLVTERKVSWDRAELMGFNRDSAIVEENCEYLEDCFAFIDKIVSNVTMGDLPMDVMIFWDSVGNTCSKDEVRVDEKTGQTEVVPSMMKAAKVISNQMRPLSMKIGNTRKVTSPKYVGAVIINNAYTKPPAFPGGMSVLTPYGGDQIYYRSTLILKTARKSKLSATKNGRDLNFGIVSSIVTEKNHISNTSNSGEFVITADRIFKNDKALIKAYKDEHKESWGNSIIFDPENGEVIDGDE
jgi:RecA/RadA recombinase